MSWSASVPCTAIRYYVISETRFRVRRLVHEGPDFLGALAGGREPSGPGQRRVEVGYVDDREPAHLLLRLRVGAVGDDRGSARRVDDGRRLRPVQAAAEDEDPRRPRIRHDGVDVGEDL